MRCLTGDECGVIKEYVSPRRPKDATAAAGDPKLRNVIEVDGVRRLDEADTMSRANGVVALNWIAPKDTLIVESDNDDIASQSTSSSKFFASLHRNGTVQVWKASAGNTDKSIGSLVSYTKASTMASVFGESAEEIALGMSHLPSSTLSSSSLVACSQRGTIVVFHPNLNDDEAASDSDDMARRTCFQAIPETALASSTTAAATSSSSNAVPPLSAFASHSSLPWVAMGGKDRDMLLFDVNSSLQPTHNGTTTTTRQPLWKAKNIAPDPQTLLQPQVWPTAAYFWSNAESSRGDNDEHQVSASAFSNLLVVGTAYRQVRIYDVRMNGSAAASTSIVTGGSSSSATTALQLSTKRNQSTASSSPSSPQQPFLPQRRPTLYTSLTERDRIVDHRVTALCALNAHYELAVADAGGDIIALDIRRLSGGAVLRSSNSPIVRRFVGPAGSVRQLVHCPHQQRLVCVGLDRMLRVYNTQKTSLSAAQSRQPLHTVYLKQRQNCVLVDSSFDLDDKDEDNDDIGDYNENDHDIDQEDKVDDYVDSDNESLQDEDDVLEEMIDALDDDNDDEEGDDDDEDEEDDDDDDEVEDTKPDRKRRRQ